MGLNISSSQTISAPGLSKANNFSAVRIYLAMCVVVAHFNGIFVESIFWAGTSAMAVKVFFVLSGFLVTSSFLGSRSMKHYVSKRLRRIFPSYLTVVVLCAFLLAGMSSLPVAGYFGSVEWWKYFVTNVLTLNFLHPSLPGVFNETSVNGSLWTIKVELACYLIIPLAICLGKRRRKRVGWVAAVMVAMSILFSYYAFWRYGQTGDKGWIVLERQVFGQLAYFLCGSLFCIFYDRLKGRLKWLLLAGVAILALSWLVRDLSALLNPFAYTLIFIPLSLIGKWGSLPAPLDISYELYLVHFPILKVLYALSVHELLGTAAAFSISVVASLACAFLLWNLVGRRFLHRPVRKLQQELA